MASVDVMNTGKRAGSAVVQLYVRDVTSRLVRPEKELKGFAKLHLQPGETATATFMLDRESLAYFDDATMTWVAEAGEFEVLAGASAADIRSTATFRLNATAQFGGNARQKKGYDLNTPLGKLLDDPEAAAVLAKHLPDMVGMAGSPQATMARGFSLIMIRGFMPSLISEAQLAGIGEDLAEL
jgi:beta-glucosidase